MNVLELAFRSQIVRPNLGGALQGNEGHRPLKRAMLAAERHAVIAQAIDYAHIADEVGIEVTERTGASEHPQLKSPMGICSSVLIVLLGTNTTRLPFELVLWLKLLRCRYRRKHLLYVLGDFL